MGFLSRILGRGQAPAPQLAPRIFLTNTLTNAKEPFIPLKAGRATLYTCGPTVYGQQHIGNLRPAVFSDTLARTLTFAGFRVHRVINITDVGHLVDNAEEGEDKMAASAKKEKVSPHDIAERYAKRFIEDLDELDVDTRDIQFPRATEYIKEQIALAKTLEEKGFAYRIRDGLYFDTSKFPGYGKLGHLQDVALRAGARVAMVEGKRNPMDFALWRTAKPGDLQQWDSPWGMGNPGWHIECSAMSRALLGIELDIHTGGEDLATIHHNDEIAQSEAANGRQFVRYWMHNAFVTMGGEKISKSLGNVVYLSDIIERGYHPLAYRYFLLQAHYRTPVSFTWNALDAAQGALARLWNVAHEIGEESGRKSAPSESRERFVAAMRDDLATPQAIGTLWETLRSEEFSPEEKWGLLEDAEAHLGLSLLSPPALSVAPEEAPQEVRELLAKRENARNAKDFQEADRLRSEIETRGYRVEDSAEGAILTRRK
ncbi:MAG TPA: cysteine--tRNA ligase [Candidatus Paceibacterota bacterium]|nr:cysteine--tRNA ligase [Candidatus Paceibacterota bacterium]